MMKKQIKIFIHALSPYKGIIYFLVMLFFSHCLWKWVVDADFHGQDIAIFGKDFTPQFYSLSQKTATWVYDFMKLFPKTDHLRINDTFIMFLGGDMILNIIWGCTGVKQFFSFFMVMVFYLGPWKKKLWYIPLSLAILWIYNIIRIAAIIFLTENNRDRFEFLHDGLFRWIFYGIIFLLWVYWEEVIRIRHKKA